MEFKDAAMVFVTQKLIPALILFVAGYFIIKLILRLETKLLESGKYVDSMLFKFIRNATRIVLWVVLLLEILKKIGVDSSSLLTVFAACGAAIALGLQGSLANLASGILIMLTKPFLHGDYIETNGVEGTVDSIDLLCTTIHTADGKTVTLPNAGLTSSTITNYSRLGKRRVEVHASISYQSDADAAKAAILAYAKSTGLFLESEPLTCDITAYNDFAIDLGFRGWVKQADYWNGYFAMQNGIKGALAGARIEIPYPRLDVYSAK